MAKDKAPETDQITLDENQEQETVQQETKDAPQAESKSEGAENEENSNISPDHDIEIARLKAALEEAEDQNMRLKADFSNFRKRKEKEMADTVVYANASLLKELLPVLDDFERTLTAMEKSDNLAAIKSGIEGVNRNLNRILKKIGMEPIGTEKGDEFDSNVHEAITTVDMGEEFSGKVFDIMERGYRLRERVLRYARVVVGE